MAGHRYNCLEIDTGPSGNIPMLQSLSCLVIISKPHLQKDLEIFAESQSSIRIFWFLFFSMTVSFL